MERTQQQKEAIIKAYDILCELTEECNHNKSRFYCMIEDDEMTFNPDIDDPSAMGYTHLSKLTSRTPEELEEYRLKAKEAIRVCITDMRERRIAELKKELAELEG